MEISVHCRLYDDRRKDLDHLERIINNPDKPQHARFGAAKAKDNILSQYKDKKLVELRHRLMRAAAAGDEMAEWRISNEIRKHTKQKQLEKPTW